MAALSMKERIEAKRGTIAAGRTKGMRTYKFKAGKTTFRILPSTDGTDFERRFLRHISEDLRREEFLRHR